MEEAHKKLKGLQLVHFHAVVRHLAEALQELDVPQVDCPPFLLLAQIYSPFQLMHANPDFKDSIGIAVAVFSLVSLQS